MLSRNVFRYPLTIAARIRGSSAAENKVTVPPPEIPHAADPFGIQLRARLDPIDGPHHVLSADHGLS